jgi:phosphate-selective porin OprO/OprP
MTMTTNRWTILLAATALSAIATPAVAAPAKQSAASRQAAANAAAIRAQLAEQRAQIEALTAQVAALTAAPAPTDATAAEEAAASSEFLKAQVDALQAQLEEVKTQTAKATPTWSGAPQLKGAGFSFKPSGQIQYDAGYVSNPGDRINTPNLGFNNRARRLVVGAAGDLPGDFKYSFQFNFAQGAVDYEDIVLSYEPKDKPFTLTVGYFYPYNTLENLTSSRFTSFVERAQMTDAFNEGRRLGVGFGYTAGDLRFNIGGFGGGINGGATTSATTVVTSVVRNPVTGAITTTTASVPSSIAAATYDNTDYEVAARLLYAPQAFGGQLHLAVNGQYRHFKTNAFGSQYRARPFSQTTDQRFVGTANIAGKSDYILGAEALGIFGPVHVAGEAQYVKVQGAQANDTVDPGQAFTGTRLASDPDFFSAYGEVGYWLTGETRGYKNGKIDRTKILNGFNKGGWGGFQLVGRVDYLDLRDRVGGANSGTQVIDGVLNGGTQTGYLAALNWWPIDYVRFTAQFSHASIEGGPNAGLVKPTSTSPLYDRKYSTNVGVIRAQIDF